MYIWIEQMVLYVFLQTSSGLRTIKLIFALTILEIQLVGEREPSNAQYCLMVFAAVADFLSSLPLVPAARIPHHVRRFLSPIPPFRVGNKLKPLSPQPALTASVQIDDIGFRQGIDGETARLRNSTSPGKLLSS
jgi:hypothetical protein